MTKVNIKTSPVGSSQALQGPINLANVCQALIKEPESVVVGFRHAYAKQLFAILFLLTLAGLLGFGLVIGLFTGGHQIWAAPLKVGIGALVAAIISLPVLYLLACVSGIDISPKEALALEMVAMSVTSLLLLGFSPVAFIFSQATDSSTLYGLVTLGIWLFSLVVGLLHLHRACRALAGGKSRLPCVIVWITVYLALSMQMATSLRPIIGSSDTFLPIEKQFFFEHWLKISDDDRW